MSRAISVEQRYGDKKYYNHNDPPEKCDDQIPGRSLAVKLMLKEGKYIVTNYHDGNGNQQR